MRRHNVIAIRASSLRSLANACEGLYPVAVADELRAAADTLDASRKPTTPQHGDDLHARLVQAGADDVIARAAQRLYVGSDTTANRNGVA
mgnify:FL=1